MNVQSSLWVVSATKTERQLKVVTVHERRQLDAAADVYLIDGTRLAASTELRRYLEHDPASRMKPILFRFTPETFAAYRRIMAPAQDFVVLPVTDEEMDSRIIQLAAREPTVGDSGDELRALEVSSRAHNPAAILNGNIGTGWFRDQIELQRSRAKFSGCGFAVCKLRLVGLEQSCDENEGAVFTGATLIVRERVQSSLRTGDLIGICGSGNLITCSHPDGFLLLLKEIRQPDDVSDVMDRIFEVLQRPIELAGRRRLLKPRGGISLYPETAGSAEGLLEAADEALEMAMLGHERPYVVYTQEMHDAPARRAVLESRLRRAIANESFELAFQPKVNIDTGATTGFEALIRWRDEQLGQVPPADFIPLAEELGLITDITCWVLDAVCRQIQCWLQRGARLKVSLNLSGHDFLNPNLVSLISETLLRWEVPAHCLELEITEGVLIENVDSTLKMLTELKALGVTVALDDFGTGYSSFSYLKDIPIDTLKLDRSFIADLVDDWQCATITSGVITICQTLGLKVVAEGVETQAQLQALRDYECDEVQGALFSMPIPASEAESWLGLIAEPIE